MPLNNAIINNAIKFKISIISKTNHTLIEKIISFLQKKKKKERYIQGSQFKKLTLYIHI